MPKTPNAPCAGHVLGAPRDAFWKSGAGGFSLYVAPLPRGPRPWIQGQGLQRWTGLQRDSPCEALRGPRAQGLVSRAQVVPSLDLVVYKLGGATVQVVALVSYMCLLCQCSDQQKSERVRAFQDRL